MSENRTENLYTTVRSSSSSAAEPAAGPSAVTPSAPAERPPDTYDQKPEKEEPQVYDVENALPKKFDSSKAEQRSRDNKRQACLAAGIITAVIFIGGLAGLIAWLVVRGSTSTALPGPDDGITTAEFFRVDCNPERDGGVEIIDQETCEERGCVYDPSNYTQYFYVPACFVPQNSDEFGFRVFNGPVATDFGEMWYLTRINEFGIYDTNFENVTFEYMMTDDHLIRFRFEPYGEEPSFEVPMELNLGSKPAANPIYEFEVVNENPFSFRIKRRNSGTVIFDTSIGGLVVSRQFLQIATTLPNTNLYGLGENLHRSFRHDFSDFITWPIFPRDQPPNSADSDKQYNLYSQQPFYEVLEDDGQAHGVLLLNSHAMDISMTPAPLLNYRVIGGLLDFYIFLGPTPENVIQQYTKAVGRPVMPPYWALGYQLTRFGYRNTVHMQDAVKRTVDNDIPLDVQYADIDHMDKQRIFTIDPINFSNISAHFEQLREGGMHTVVILDPCVEISNDYSTYARGKNADVFIKWQDRSSVPPGDFQENNDTMMGYVWPEWKVVFPDFFNSATATWWTDELRLLRQRLEFDGIWLDMNEIANFGTNEERPWNWPVDRTPYWSLKCPQSALDDPPYRTKAAYQYDNPSANIRARLSSKTLCMQGTHANGMVQYDVHSLYGWQQARVNLDSVREVLRNNKRGFQITRAGFTGTGAHAGRWLGDNSATWLDLRLSIIGILESNLFGIPYIGADICGFFGDTTIELCSRWHQLGAFYTFSRNHNHESAMDQDPGSLGDRVIRVAKEAMTTRYTLLPYLYTLFHEAHVHGSTVIRPLMHEFFNDQRTLGTFTQFMWGPALLISPILDEGITVFSYYLPPARWYDYYTGLPLSAEGGERITQERIRWHTQIPLAVRGGYVIPTQAPATNTFFSRQNGFGMIVALDELDGFADGYLFWDDGESLDTYENGEYLEVYIRSKTNVLDLAVNHNGLAEPTVTLASVTVLGVTVAGHVYVDGSNHGGFDFTDEVLTITGLSLNLTTPHRIEWRGTRFATGDEAERVDCCPGGCSGGQCGDKACVSGGVGAVPEIPACYIDRALYGYQTVLTDPDRLTLNWKAESSMFGADVPEIYVTLLEYTNIARVRIYDDKDRFVVPHNLNLPEIEANQVRFETGTNPFGFYVQRYTGPGATDGTILFNTQVLGGLTFAEQFFQVAGQLPSSNVYGFGEHLHPTLRHDMNFKTWPMFARDQPPTEGANLYSTMPFYLCVEDDGKAHGVLFWSSQAMEVSLQPAPSVTFRTTGGLLDMYFILGDNPSQVISRYHSLIGTPFLPPYWGLGFHLSRYRYDHIDNMRSAVSRTTENGIPLDVVHLDIDSLDERKAFTYDRENWPDLPQFINSLHGSNVKVVNILNPFLISNETEYEPYELGMRRNIFVKWPAGENPDYEIYENDNLLGWVWPKGRVVFPDFFKSNTTLTWEELITSFYGGELPVDGLWLDMNEPANFGTNEDRAFNWPEDDTPYWTLKCPPSEWDDPSYKPSSIYGPRLSDKTICMKAVHDDGNLRHYDVHNLFGHTMSQTSLAGIQSASGKRGLIVSRSMFPGSGQYAGHWLGDNDSSWLSIRQSIIGMLEFNIFGIPFVGADICGYFGNVTTELCERWHQLGAFYPFSRNHNGAEIDQDPGIYGETSAYNTRQVYLTRYRLLPYLYSLFYVAHASGGTVARGLFEEFPTDQVALRVDEQFMWGAGLLITPVLRPAKREVVGYFPDARWFDYYTGAEMMARGQHIRLDAPIDTIPLHVRGGSIMLTQEPEVNTGLSRNNALGLVIALDDDTSATGPFFWDDGDSIDTTGSGAFTAATLNLFSGNLSMTNTNRGSTDLDSKTIQTIRLLGLDQAPVISASSFGFSDDYAASFNDDTKEFLMAAIGLSMNEDFWILFNFR